MDELFLYDRDKGLFKQILKQSKVMEGRYQVSPSYGHALNTDNLDNFLSEGINGIIDLPQKWPMCVCMPPGSVLGKDDNGSFKEDFVFELFFLCTSGYTSTNKVKFPDRATGQSMHHVWYDWKDMKEVALEFLKMLERVIKLHKLKSFMVVDFSRIPVRRITKINNDSVSGVSISIAVDFDAEVCDHADYEDDSLSKIVLPAGIIHKLHKH